MKKMLFGLSVLAAGSVSTADSLLKQVVAHGSTSQAEVCTLPTFPNDFVTYQKEMSNKFYGNLPSPQFIPKDVTLRFFLTTDGVIRDVSIRESSGDHNTDLACVDAVYSASPLPPPPPLRVIPPPPPVGKMMPPDSFGSGVYTFTFGKTRQTKMFRVSPIQRNVCSKKRSWTSTPIVAEKYTFRLVPNEVAAHYPGVFAPGDLDVDANLLLIDKISLEQLEKARFQWGQFYRNNEHPSKEDITQWAQQVADFYVRGKTTAAKPPSS